MLLSTARGARTIKWTMPSPLITDEPLTVEEKGQSLWSDPMLALSTVAGNLSSILTSLEFVVVSLETGIRTCTSCSLGTARVSKASRFRIAESLKGRIAIDPTFASDQSFGVDPYRGILVESRGSMLIGSGGRRRPSLKK
jgi:hypothetical protein